MAQAEAAPEESRPVRSRLVLLSRRIVFSLLLATAALFTYVSVVNLFRTIASGAYADPAKATDFTCFYAAGRAVPAMGAAALYEWGSLLPYVQDLIGRPDAPYLPWFYPPPFLLLLEPLAHLSLEHAHLAWSAATLTLLAAVLCAIAGRFAVVELLACLLTWAEVGNGQNGFLNAALLGGALLLADRRPLAAGVLAGLLAYKPQFAVMLPVLLLATQNWRALAAAALTGAVMAAASAARYGVASWLAFVRAGDHSAQVLLDGQVLRWGILQSPFALLRWLDGGYTAAFAVQVAVAGAALAAIIAVGIRPFSPEIRGGITALGTALATPYLLVWDTMLLAVAVAFLARLARRQGYPAWQMAVVFGAVAAPFAAAYFPMGVPFAAVLAVPLAYHARREQQRFSARRPADGVAPRTLRMGTT